MQVSFYLKNPKLKGETSIFLLFHFGYKEKTNTGKEVYKPVKLYIKDKINPAYWNKKEGRAKEISKFPEYSEFNQGLENIEASVRNLYRTLNNKKKQIITPEQFKKEWDNLNTNKVKHKTDFIEFVDGFIENVKTKRKEGTLKNYRNSFRHIKEFGASKNIPLTFENITLDFHLDFIEYLKNTKKFAPNTIWRINKILKMFMNESTDRGLNTNLDFKSKRFSVKPEEPDVIYLTESELNKIYFKEFANKKLDRVRDLFLIACYTGLRFSDLSKLTQNNIVEFEGVKMLRIKTQKTDQTVTIPINAIVKQIIDKYQGAIPKGMSNQKFNDYLKDVAKLSEVKEKIVIPKTRGNLTTEKTFEKWQLVTTHTARRSFATNAYLAKIPTISIMAITGHKTEKAFLRYIRITGDENALVLSKHEFFSKTPLKVV